MNNMIQSCSQQELVATYFRSFNSFYKLL